MGIRTDLALECREMYAGEISGVESKKQSEDGAEITHVTVTSEEGAQKIGKPMGNYITIQLENMNFENDEVIEKGAKTVSQELKKIINISDDASVLVAGLGNRDITPDSVGPKAVGKLFVTRHLKDIKDDKFNFDFRPVSAIAPGVLGITGIETGEIIAGIEEKIKPDIIIAIDALASRKLNRLGTTIQISDTGINPGSGVGNNRRELSEKTMGIPVIAIGIPTVVDAATITSDVIESIENYLNSKGEEKVTEAVNSLSEEKRTSLIKEALSSESENMVVTPNNIDVITDQAAEIIAKGINIALHGEEVI